MYERESQRITTCKSEPLALIVQIDRYAPNVLLAGGGKRIVIGYHHRTLEIRCLN